MTSRFRRLLAAVAAAALAAGLLVAAGCGGDDGGGSGGAGDGAAVRIADKGFSESFIVAQAYAAALADRGFAPEVRSLGSTEIAIQAVERGDIDVYPEYEGTVFLNVLGRDADAAPDEPDAQFEEIRKGLAGRGLTALPPAPFNNGNEVACTQDAVDRYDITTLSDLGEASPNLVYSANAEHLTRPDGLPLLRRQYGVNFKDVRTVDISLRYKPIEDGQADCVYAFGTDPKLGQLPLVVLEDDKGAYSAGVSFRTFPVVNTVWYDGLSEAQRTELTDTIAAVNEQLTADAIRPLIARVEFDREDPDVVARDFLRETGVIE